MQSKRWRHGRGDWIDGWTDEWNVGAGIDKTEGDLAFIRILLPELKARGDWHSVLWACLCFSSFLFVCLCDWVRVCARVCVCECLPVAQLKVSPLRLRELLQQAQCEIWGVGEVACFPGIRGNLFIYFFSLSLGLIRRVDYHSEHYPHRRSL